MAIVIAGMLGLLSLAVLVFPFLKHRRRGPLASHTAASASVGVGLDAVYDSIRSLQLEHQLGNVPEDAYQEQLQGYRVQAAMLLKRQSEDQDQIVYQALEQEILAARSAMKGTDNIAATCPDCDSSLTSQAQNCPQCHAKLMPALLETSGEVGE